MLSGHVFVVPNYDISLISGTFKDIAPELFNGFEGVVNVFENGVEDSMDQDGTWRVYFLNHQVSDTVSIDNDPSRIVWIRILVSENRDFRRNWINGVIVVSKGNHTKDRKIKD